jgi:hypothetical protein
MSRRRTTRSEHGTNLVSEAQKLTDHAGILSDSCHLNHWGRDAISPGTETGTPLVLTPTRDVAGRECSVAMSTLARSSAAWSKRSSGDRIVYCLISFFPTVGTLLSGQSSTIN